MIGLADNLPTGPQSFFKDDLGFPIQKLSDQAVSAKKFLGENYTEDRHGKIKRIYLSGYVGDEAVRPDDGFSDRKKRYKGMLLLTVELDTHSPTYNEIGLLTSTINRATPALPVAVLYIYNKGARMALSSCERFKYKQKSRIGERMGKTASLIDINVRKPSRAHKELLDSLSLNKLSGAGDIETILTEWRELLRGNDRSLLSEICRDYISEKRSFPPLDHFDEIFGREAIAAIRNTPDWGYYYNFLSDSVHSNAALTALLDDSIVESINRQMLLFRERHGINPSPRILQTQNRYKDLLFFREQTVADFVKKAAKNEKTEVPLLKLITSIKHSVAGGMEQDEGDEEDDSPDQTSEDDNWRKELPQINISQEAIEDGEYDGLAITRYSIPKEYRKFVFEYIRERCAFNTIGDIRKLSPDDALNFKSFNGHRYEALEAIQSRLSEVARNILIEQEINSKLDDFEDEELDFPINEALTPRWLVPVGAGRGNTLLHLLKLKGLTPTVLELKNLSIGDFTEFKAIQQSRIDEFLRLKLSLPRIIELRAALEMMRNEAESDLIIDPRIFENREQVTVNKILWVTRSCRLRIRHLLLDFDDREIFKNAPKKYHFKHLDTWRLSLIKQQTALALYRGDRSAFITGEHPVATLPELQAGLEQYMTDWLSGPIFRKNDLLKKCIFLVRHGIGTTKFTLQEIGDFGLFEGSRVCRERVRQLQVEAEKRFICSLPFLEEDIQRLLSNRTIDTVQSELPLLYNLMGSSNRQLQRLLGFVADDTSLFLDIEQSLLDSFFAQTPQPINKHQIIRFIEDSLDEEDLATEKSETNKTEIATEVFNTLALKQVIQHKDDRVIPRKLPPKEATAHILAGEPNGLHFEDVYSMLTELPYTNKELNKRYVKNLLTDPYVYLAGTFGAGTVFAHKNFLPEVDEDILSELADWIHEQIELQPDKREDLRTIHRVSQIGRDWDYHVFRYFVRELSSDYAFRFDGKSRADNICLTGAGEKRIGNEERVLRLVDEAKNGITQYELVQNFHCKSAGLIGVHLSDLISKGKAMKLTPRLYIAKKNLRKLLDREESEAYKSIPRILARLLDECEDTAQILDTRLVCREVNRNSLTDLSPSLVQSTVSSEARKQGWHISQSLVSRNKLEYNSLSDIFIQECTPDMNLNQAMHAVSDRVATTQSALKNTFYNYRLATGVAGT